jgi:hypothetical protein
MNCFTGLVYLKGCSVTELPESVYSLNSLSGISLRSFGEVADAEQKNYLGVWENINERAEARIKNQIISKMSMRYDIKRVKRTVDTGNILPQTNTVHDSKFKGLVINGAYTFTDSWMMSPFQTFSIDKIRFYKRTGTTATTVDVRFFNYLTKEVLFTKTLTMADCVENEWTSFDILKKFTCPVLGIGFRDSEIHSVSYPTNDLNILWGGCMDYCFDSNCGYLRSFESSNASQSGTLTQGDTITGLQAVITVGCEYDAAVCSNRLLFAEAYWYLLGIEFMTERLFSERVNFLTTLRKEEARELLDLYAIRYEEAINNAITGLKFSCDACLECDSLSTVITRIP